MIEKATSAAKRTLRPAKRGRSPVFNFGHSSVFGFGHSPVFNFKRPSESSFRHSLGLTLAELIVSMMIVSIVGAAAVTGLFMTLLSSRQSDDYVSASIEIENATRRLRPQFTAIGLGMPNNAGGTGSFNAAFTGQNDASHPIMFYMGDPKGNDTSWGGPVTLGAKGAQQSLDDIKELTVKARNADGVFAGDVLFYAWAVPTGVQLSSNSGGDVWLNLPLAPEFSSRHADKAAITFKLRGGRNDVTALREFEYDGRAIGIDDVVSQGSSTRSWMLFPSFKVPLLIEAAGIGTETIDAKVAPYAPEFEIDGEPCYYEGELNGYEEVHLLQAGCVFAEEGRLIRRVYRDSTDDYTDETLANNIAGVYFVFDDARRLLTMYLVAYGRSVSEVSPAENREYLKSTLPGFIRNDFIPRGHMSRRLITDSMTWRIRN